MSFPQTGTKLTNMVNPEVLAQMVSAKLPAAIKFSPLATIDNTLVGVPGNTIKFPNFVYVGAADDLNEGADLTVKQLTTSTATATVKKCAVGIQLTDEAVLSGYGSPIDESVAQIVKSIADKVDNDMLSTLGGIAAGMTHTCSAGLTADDIADALTKFGEDIEGDKVILICPADYAKLRKADDWLPASDIAASLLIGGVVGMIHGCQVVVSNKLKAKGQAFIVKPGALRLVMKRDALVETDRDILNFSTVITGSEHYVTYLYDASKAIKIATGTTI